MSTQIKIPSPKSVYSGSTIRLQGAAIQNGEDFYTARCQQIDKKIFVISAYNIYIITDIVNWLNENQHKYILSALPDTNNIVLKFKKKADATFFKLSVLEENE